MRICSGQEQLQKTLQPLRKTYYSGLAAAVSAHAARGYCSDCIQPIAAVKHHCVKNSNCQCFWKRFLFVQRFILHTVAVSPAIVILFSAAVLQYLLQQFFNAYCSGCVIPIATVLEYLLQRLYNTYCSSLVIYIIAIL